jgi:hypothetical protein
MYQSRNRVQDSGRREEKRLITPSLAQRISAPTILGQNHKRHGVRAQFLECGGKRIPTPLFPAGARKFSAIVGHSKAPSPLRSACAVHIYGYPQPGGLKDSSRGLPHDTPGSRIGTIRTLKGVPDTRALKQQFWHPSEVHSKFHVSGGPKGRRFLRLRRDFCVLKGCANP